MDGLKQRIIGALVLVSLAVIFVPMVFDEPHSERTSTSINIPEEPPFPEVTAPESSAEVPPVYQQSEGSAPASDTAPGYRLVEEPAALEEARLEADSEADIEAGQPAPDVEKTETAEAAPAAAEETGAAKAPREEEAETADYSGSLEGAWVVQLGSFGNADNARRLRDRVREDGYGSHLQRVARGDTTLTRVFSGPFATKTDAEEAKRKLDAAFGLNSLVTTGDK